MYRHLGVLGVVLSQLRNGFLLDTCPIFSWVAFGNCWHSSQATGWPCHAEIFGSEDLAIRLDIRSFLLHLGWYTRTFQVTWVLLGDGWSKRAKKRHFRSSTHSPSSSSLGAGMSQSQTGMFSISFLECWGSLVLTQDFSIIFFNETFQ